MSTQALPRYTLKDVDDLITDVREQPTRKAKVDHLTEQYPHIGRSWIEHRLHYLVLMDSTQLVEVLGLPDPTGEHATSNVLHERGF